MVNLMPRTIILPEELYARIAALAQPFVDREPADVIRRLIESYDPAGEVPGDGMHRTVATDVSEALLRARNPRERGTTVELDGQRIQADSVRDLYEQALTHLAKNGKLDRVREMLPYKTSSKRYLIAEQPVHPNGN